MKREEPFLTPAQEQVMGHLERLKGISDEVLGNPMEPTTKKSGAAGLPIELPPLDGANVQI